MSDTRTITDDFLVQEVFLTILNSDGTEVEHGLAQSATAANNSLAGDKIIICACDLPGHTTEK